MNLVFLDIEGTLVTTKSMFKATFDHYEIPYSDKDFLYDNYSGINQQLINNFEVHKALSDKPEPKHLEFPNYEFDKECVKKLNLLYDLTKCNYIIIGPYKGLTIGQLNKLFKINGVHGVVIAKTINLDYKRSYTKQYLVAEEILSYLSVNDPGDDNKFCIISSDISKIKPMFGDKCIQIDFRSGFGVSDLINSEQTMDLKFSNVDLIYSLDNIVKNNPDFCGIPWMI